MKMQVYSQWMEDVYVPVRVKQFTKAAKLMGKHNFSEYADLGMQTEHQAVAAWLDEHEMEAVAGIA